jgi:hypothetical protein
MRFIFTVFLLIATNPQVSSANWGTHAPSKVIAPISQNIPTIPRQGGDTIIDALPIEGIPFDITGTTSGFYNDYDIECPVDSHSPDVVYSYCPSSDLMLTIDLLGSSYDTKVYIFDEMLQLVACNDDYYHDYVSKIESAPLLGGENYFIIVDGYGGDHGNYVMHMEEYHQCELLCPDGATLENEPSLEEDYVDAYNGGCNSLEILGYAPFQTLESSVFYGTSGWYEYLSEFRRDTDWFTATIPEVGFLEITLIAEVNTLLFELAPQDCESVAVVQSISLLPCMESTMTISGDAGAEVLLWVGPNRFSPPWNFEGQEYNYTIFTNIQIPVALEARSWDSVKAMYR